MAVCQIAGHPDNYGLGIRSAFYIQWFGMIIVSWLLESDALNLNFLNALTVGATSVGFALNMAILQPVELYVILLLVCGNLYFLVPVYIWKLMTCCRPWWDTEKWKRVKIGWLFKTGMYLLFGTLLGFQIWFWTTGVHDRPATDSDVDESCQQYGFLFSKVQIDNPGFITFNLAISLIMLAVGSWLFFDWIGMFDECKWHRRKKKRRWRMTYERIYSLQQLRTISDVIVAAILTMAIELTISWNHIGGVDNLDTVAQLIPLVISAAYLLRSIYVWLLEPSPEFLEYDDSYFLSGSNTVTSGGGGNLPTSHTVYLGTASDWPQPRQYSHSTRPHHYRRHSRVSHPVADSRHYIPEVSAVPGVSSAAPVHHPRVVTVEDDPDGDF